MSKISGDRDLGMNRSISRRDFIHGTGAVLAGVATGWPGSAGAADGAPPASVDPALRTGLRGAHPGSFEVAHAMAREGRRDFGPVADRDDDDYDLVVVGAGISGLAAAFFHLERHPDARVLILDNHDDFGGHAKRNEFQIAGRTLLGHGGSQTLEAPSRYSDVSQGLLRKLGVDVDRFETAYDRGFYDRHGLSSAVYFDRETWGEEKVVRADLFAGSEYFVPIAKSGTSFQEAVAQLPMPESARAELLSLLRLHDDRVEAPIWREPSYLRTISYQQFLERHAGVTRPEVGRFLRDMLSIYYGTGLDAVPALDAMLTGAPGLGGTGLGMFEGWIRRAIGWLVDPYIHHFPDGNASIARLLVRRMVSGVAPGSTMEDIVTAPFDYPALDRPDSPVRIRLESTVVRVLHEGDPGAAKAVDVVYVRNGRAQRVRAKQCVLACWHAVIPSLCPELPEPQRQALKSQVKVPLVYTNVALTNWRAFAKAGIGLAYCPGGGHTMMMLDFPVSLGDYRYSATPDDPVVVDLFWALGAEGLTPREQHRAGRHQLMATPFEQIERGVRGQLAGVVGAAGFDPARDIAAITVNRWPHGYAYTDNPLYDPDYAEGEAPHEVARQRFGRIAIANSDAAARAYLDAAVDEAWRAVEELDAS